MLGLAFKPNTDEVRFAPSIAIAKLLLAEGVEVRAYDPEGMEKTKVLLPKITYCNNAYEAAEGADAVLLLTEWEEFQKMDWCRLATLVESRLIIDGRNALPLDDLTRNGFEYVGIGGLSARPRLEPAMITV